MKTNVVKLEQLTKSSKVASPAYDQTKETKRKKSKSVRRIRDSSGVGKPKGRRTNFQKGGSNEDKKGR